MVSENCSVSRDVTVKLSGKGVHEKQVFASSVCVIQKTGQSAG